MKERQALPKLYFKSRRFVGKQAPTILTCISVAGVVATSVATAKGATKASKLLETAKEEKGEELTKTEKFKIASPSYIPAVAIGTATIACIFGSNVLNKRQQASLASAYLFLDQSYKEYKNKAKDLYGEDANERIEEEIAKDKYKEVIIKDDTKQLFYDEYSKRYFESTIVKVQQAEYQLNRDFIMRDYATVNEFYDYLGLDPIEGGDEFGWSTGLCFECYWQMWLDFTHTKVTLDDGRECIKIHMFQEPIFDFENYYEN